MKTLINTMLFFVATTTVFAQVKYENEAKAIDIMSSTTKVFKDNPKEIIITDFKIIYRMFKGEAIQGSGYSDITNTSYGTSATMNVMMSGVTKDDLLKNANEIYADFVNDLESKGYKVGTLDAEQIKANKRFSKDGDAKILNGQTFESTHKNMLQSISAVPAGVNTIELKAPEKADPSARGGGGGGMSDIKKGFILNDLLEGREVLRLSITLAIDFLDFTKKGKTLSGSPELHIGRQYVSGCNTTYVNKKMIIGTYNGISNKPIYLENSDWAGEMQTTTNVEVLGSKLKNYELPVNSEKYCASTKILVKGFFDKYFSSYESFVADLNK